MIARSEMGGGIVARKKSVTKPRRARGTGTIFADRRRGGYVARVPVGQLPSGRTRYVEVRGKTQAEVVEKMRGVRPPDPDSVTVADWCARWIGAQKVRPSSLKVYRARLAERIVPALGHLKLKELTAWHVEEAAAKWAGNANTVRDTISTLSAIVQAARRARLVTENVVELARRPKASDTKFDLFERPELARILGASFTRPQWHTFAVLVLTGCRIGEALALRPSDYDAAKGTLTISRTWTAAGEGPPKSKNSARTMAHVPARLGALLAAGVPRVHYATAVSRWKRLLQSLGLRFRSLHQVRHSCATYALADGVPVVDLAAHLGHTPEELLRTYGHRTGADVSGAFARIAGA